jgi:hypothetical protein
VHSNFPVERGTVLKSADIVIAAERLSPNLPSVEQNLNQVTAATALSVLLSSLTGKTRNISIPGVRGLPGGYPFILKNRKCTLRLPPGITLEEAVAHNKTENSPTVSIWAPTL